MEKRYLIDTQCWLWWHINPEKLSQRQYTIIEDGENEVYFSVVSAWEISIKYRLKKLKLPCLPSSYIRKRIASGCMNILALQMDHSLYVEDLPACHSDPFDRLLITQAQLEDMTIITNDQCFNSYDVQLIL